MPIISKFGSTPSSDQRLHRDQHFIFKTIERILRSRTYLGLNKDGDFDAKDTRIANVGNPVFDGDGANKRFVEAVIWTAFNDFPKDYLDVRHKRVVRVGYPATDDDGVNKRYVDDRLSFNFSILLLKLEADADDHYLLRPYKSREYEFPFDADVKISKTNFNPNEVSVSLNENTVIETIFEGSFHSFAKGDKIRFFRVNNESRKNAYVEMVIRSRSSI